MNNSSQVTTTAGSCDASATKEIFFLMGNAKSDELNGTSERSWNRQKKD